MSAKTFISRSLSVSAGAVLAAYAGSAAAIDFDVFGTEVKVDNLITIGGSWRMQGRDDALIGKASLHRLNNPITDPTAPVGSAANPRGLCYTRRGDNGVNGPQRDTGSSGAGGNIQLLPGVIPNGCGTGTLAAIQAFVAAPGGYNPSGDNGNLSFDKGDIVHAIAKLTSDISFSIADYNVFIRPIYYFDVNYVGFEEVYSDTTLQSKISPLSEDGETLVGTDFHLLDAHISHVFDVPWIDRELSVKVGKQALNWGESSLLIFNSLNTINPPDASKLRFPGLDLKEILQPVGMVVLGADVMENVGLEVFYQYEWKPLVIDPPGTFFSQSDVLGDGGFYAQNGQGREPDDPDGLFRGIDTCGFAGNPAECFSSAGTLGSTSSRIVPRNFEEEAKRKTEDGGQFGAKLQLFLEDFNNGTELSFYFANYHSRLPIISAIAATQRSCITSLASLAPGGDCGYLGPGMAAGEETLPVDTISVLVEYPEDIQMYGASFNTTVGDWALSGEIAYRPKLPTQIHSLDLSVAALGAAFPRNNVNLGIATIGQRSSFPDFVSLYRGIAGGYDNGDYIRGYEELETATYNATLLKLIGGDNPLGASQITFLLELGLNQVFNLPPLDELQFQGGGTNTPISSGADGSVGINPRDQRTDPNDPSTNSSALSTRQNGTAHKDLDGFGSDISYGYRNINIIRWDDALFGANLQTLAIIRHDLEGTAPGVGTNFTQGRKEFNLGLSFEYLAQYFGEVRYTWFTGGAGRDGLRDRDNIFVTLGYQF